MKRFYTLLVLCLSVFSTLMAETYTQKVTVYAPATCTTTDIVFYGYKNKSDKSPYKTISGQPTSMYMNGLVLYKAEIPFNDVVYVKCTYKTNTGDENSEFSNEITQTCSRYCGLDEDSSMPVPAWYNTFDEAKYNQELFDLNYKAKEGTLYVVYDKGYHSTISVYSSEYGEQYKTDISANTVAEYSLLGNTLLAYTVADYEVYDRVIHNYESTYTIDWNKPFYYDGVWYAKLSDIPIKNLLKEESCYRIVLADRITEMYHIGDNIYSCLYNGSSKGLYYFNKDSETKFECKTNCGATLATMNVELKQYGYYTLEFTYNANTNKIECKSELQQADKYIIRAFDYSSIYNAPQMELVGENEYSFSLTTTRDKGLYYYNIDFVSYNGYTSERIKDKLIQIQETGTYDITITYNAETQATSCTVNKADPLAPIYLRGTVNNWGVDERYKLTTTDGNYYVATYTKGNEVEIGDVNGGTAEFKIGSGNSDYSPINFGGNKVIERGGTYRLSSKGVNLKVNGSLKVSKIEFWLSENKLTITPADQEVKKIYYVNKWGWYNVDINVEPQGGISDYFSMNKESVTYQGYEVYSYEVPTYYSTVYFDGYGQYEYSYTTTIALDFTKPYYYDGVWYETLTFDTESEGGEGEDEGGDDNGNDNTGGDNTGDDNTGGDDEGGEVTPPTPTVFDTTTDQGVAFVVNPNSANPVFVPLTYSYNAEYNTAQYTGTYTVTELGITAKIGGLTNFDVINFGTNGQALAPNYVYNPTRGASNGFTITGDYKVGDILNIYVTFGSDWYADVIINVIPTLAPTENDITLYYVNVNDWSTVYGYVWPTGGVGLLDWPGSPATKTDKTVDGYDVYSYTFDSTQADNIIFNNGGNGSQTADLAVVASKPYYYNGVWYETLTFDATGGDEGGNEGGGDTPVVPGPTPEPEGLAFFVAGNGGSDATGIWCNGIEWSSVGVETANNMTDADKDGIYEITFNQVPAGTWNFKVVGVTEGNMSWMGSDFLDTTNSSAGYTTAPYDGNIGFTLTQAANVTVKFNTATGKIILTTPSGSFEKVVIEHFHILTGNNQCLDEFEFTEANNYTIVLTQEVLIDEEYGVAYVGCGILGNCDYAVYEKYFSIEVTENGTYTVTVQFNGDYENPDFTVTAVKQGGTIDPDPVVAIKNLKIQPFEQVLPNTTTTTVATFILENASTATVTIEGLDADFFEIGEQNIGNGEYSVSIVFKPIVIGVYYATLTVTTEGGVSLSIDFAAAAGDETFEPGDVPELNPDPVNPDTPDDEVSVEEVSAIMIYAKEGTIYSEVEFEIYDLAGINVTKLNGSLQGVYIVKTAEGNRLISVW